MNENTTQDSLQHALQALVGLPLSIARNAADMKVFHFGPVRPYVSKRGRSGTVGTYAIHIQCPWRIVSETAVLTGTTDYFVGPHEGMESDYDNHRTGTRQLMQIGALLKGYDETTKSYVNATDHLVVVSVCTDKYGGADILFSGDYRLQIFPTGSISENWRFVELEGRHVVVESGRVDVEEM